METSGRKRPRRLKPVARAIVRVPSWRGCAIAPRTRFPDGTCWCGGERWGGAWQHNPSLAEPRHTSLRRGWSPLRDVCVSHTATRLSRERRVCARSGSTMPKFVKEVHPIFGQGALIPEDNRAGVWTGGSSAVRYLNRWVGSGLLTRALSRRTLDSENPRMLQASEGSGP